MILVTWWCACNEFSPRPVVVRRADPVSYTHLVTLDESLLKRAQLLSGVQERSALLREALNALIQRESARRLTRLGGDVYKRQILLLFSFSFVFPIISGTSFAINTLFLPMGKAICIILFSSFSDTGNSGLARSLKRITLANSPPNTDL